MAGTPKKLQYDSLKKPKIKPLNPYYVFDERKYGYKIAHLPLHHLPTKEQLNILALHYKENFPSEVESRLRKFLEDRIKIVDLKNYAKLMRKWDKHIKNAVVYSKIRGFAENNPIYFSKAELDYILTIDDDFDRQYLLFSMCCILKHKMMINNQKSYVINAKKWEYDFKFDDDFSGACSILTKKTPNACGRRISYFKKQGIIMQSWKNEWLEWIEKVDKDNAVLELVVDENAVDKFIEYTRNIKYK